MRPVVFITAPGAGRTLSNIYQKGSCDVPVVGTFAGDGPSRWVLEVGPGVAPAGWTSVASGTGPFRNGDLGTWHTRSIEDGVYTLRLQAWDAEDRRAEASIQVTLANFSVSQDVLEFNPSSGKTVTYTSEVPFPLTETLAIKDQQGRTVRTLRSGPGTAGRHTDTWDGRSDAGALVPDGPYFVVARVSDGEHSMTWDLTSQYLNNYFDSKDSLKIEPFDPFNNRPMTFTYNSPVPGNVTISVLTKSQVRNDCDQPPDKALCLVNRRYEESGQHTFVWAGVDSKGVYRAGNYSLVSVTTIRDRFSRNAVVVYGTRPAISNVTVTPPALAPGQPATVAFDLATHENQHAVISVAFQNQSSLSILKTIVLGARSPGHLSVTWDGRSDSGVLVAPGFYTVTVTAVDEIGNRARGQILATVRR